MKRYYFAIYNSTAPDGSLFDSVEAERLYEAEQKIKEKYPDAVSFYKIGETEITKL